MSKKLSFTLLLLFSFSIGAVSQAQKMIEGQRAANPSFFNAEADDIWVDHFQDGHALFVQDGHFGVIDTNGLIIVPAQSHHLRMHQGKLTLVEPARLSHLIPPFLLARASSYLIDKTDNYHPYVVNGDGDTNRFEIRPVNYTKLTYHRGIARTAVFNPNGKHLYGAVDSNGRIILPIVFEYLSEFKYGIALAGFGERNFYINRRGEIIDYLPQSKGRALPRFETDNIAYKKDSGFVHIDTLGELIHDKQFDYAEAFQGDYAVVQAAGKYGVINRQGDWVIPAVSEHISLRNGHGISVKQGRFYQLRNAQNEVIIDSLSRAIPALGGHFYDVQNERLRYYRADGKLVFELENVSRALNPMDPHVLIRNTDGKTGIFTRTGQQIYPFDLVRTSSKNGWSVFNAERDGKYGLIDAEGQVILPFELDNSIRLTPYDGIARSSIKGKQVLVNYKGEKHLPAGEANYSMVPIMDNSHGPYAVIVEQEGSYDVMDGSWTVLIPNRYRDIEHLGGNLFLCTHKEEEQVEVRNIDFELLASGPLNYKKNQSIIHWPDKETEQFFSIREQAYLPPIDENWDRHIDRDIYQTKHATQSHFGLRKGNGKSIIPVGDLYNFVLLYYDQGYILAKSGSTDLYGVYDTLGRQIIAHEYTAADFDISGEAIVLVKDNSYYYFTPQGELILQQNPANTSHLHPYREGLMACYEDGLYGFKNRKNKWVIEPRFEVVPYGFSMGQCLVEENERMYIIDTKGRYMYE